MHQARDPAPDAEFFIVLNAGSGNQEKDAVRAAIEAGLREAGRKFRFVPVGEDGIVAACQQAARMAAEAGGVLVAAGGDGTLNCAAQAAMTHDCPLGVVAQGTFNLFAREHGLPLEADAAARVLVEGVERPVQVGWVNQRAFLVSAAVGLYPQLLVDREAAKEMLGRHRVVALLAGVKSLFEWRKQLVLDAELDGKLTHMRTTSLYVCNNQLQLQRVGIAEELVAQVGAGRLAGLAAGAMGLGAKLRLLLRGLLGSLGEASELHSFTLRSLTVASRRVRRMKVATDGEVQWMELPLRFTVAPQPLRVLLPGDQGLGAA